MQSLLNKSIKILPCSPSELGNLQSAILFMLSAATAIIAQKKKKNEISAMLIPFVVTQKSNCNVLNFDGANKSHIYAIPLPSTYFVSVHYEWLCWANKSVGID